jgi:alpha-D-ribose 1-methylphosphonate 5-triphosphate synthase subunit PhnL
MSFLEITGLGKGFTLHLRGGRYLPSLAGFQLQMERGECVAVTGPSGAGKSTLLRCIYGNYRAEAGQIRLAWQNEHVDITQLLPRQILMLRRWQMAWASQFLRVIPRVSTLDLVTEIPRSQGLNLQEARERATDTLGQLRIPPALHALPPATFSGGEQQRVNLARAFVGEHPLLLLDEPTASLDGRNRQIVATLIRRARDQNRAILAVFHDPQMVEHVADRQIVITPPKDLPCALPESATFA